ncbi:putative phosphomannomutase [Rhodotorula sp. JG-1b]|nr:putative phosphomannomutase [Rhodotorula sp. JG-1b]
MASVVPFSQRERGDVICLFDVDGTLTPARRTASPEMLDLLKQVRQKAVIGFVGGSDLAKITEQLAVHGQNITDDFDFCFAENGLTAIRLGKELESQSFIKWLGEEKYKKLVRFILHYIADLDIPIKRGTFIEFRNGMINVSPIGRNASVNERNEFEAYDKEHKVRAKLVELLKKEFADFGLTYSIGGQISFDVFPHGWDKTYSLPFVQRDNFKEIHFFGDKTYQGGNDYEIFTDERTIGHSVTKPEDTMAELRKLFNL